MNKTVREVEVVIGVSDDGKFVAASTSSPYFCFVADTEDAVRERVDAAARFYRSAHGELQKNPIKSRTRSWTVTKLIPTGVLEKDCLAVA